MMPPKGYTPRPDPNHNPIVGPFNAIPPLVLALVVVLAGIEAVLSLGATGLVGGPQAIGWRIGAIEQWSFVPGVWDVLLLRGPDWDLVSRFVTYAFVHGSLTHALFGVALLLALGKFVGDVLHPVSLALLLLATTVAGAVGFGLLVSTNYPLYGVYPTVYGLIGAFTYLMWLRLGREGSSRIAAFRLIGFLMGIQLVFGLLFGSDPAWVADASGFVAGLALAPLLAPGGTRAFVERMRRR